MLFTLVADYYTFLHPFSEQSRRYTRREITLVKKGNLNVKGVDGAPIPNQMLNSSFVIPGE